MSEQLSNLSERARYLLARIGREALDIINHMGDGFGQANKGEADLRYLGIELLRQDQTVADESKEIPDFVPDDWQ